MIFCLFFYRNVEGRLNFLYFVSSKKILIYIKTCPFSLKQTFFIIKPLQKFPKYGCCIFDQLFNHLQSIVSVDKSLSLFQNITIFKQACVFPNHLIFKFNDKKRINLPKVTSCSSYGLLFMAIRTELKLW